MSKPNTEHETRNTEDGTPNAEHKHGTQNTEHETPIAKGLDLFLRQAPSKDYKDQFIYFSLLYKLET